MYKEHYYCPIQRIDATEHATTASTSWMTVCAASATSTSSALPDAAIVQPSLHTTEAQPSPPRASPPQPAATQTRPFTALTPMPTAPTRPRPTTLSPVTMAGPSQTAIPTLELVRKARIDDEAEHAALEGRNPTPAQKGAAAGCPTTFIVQPPKTAGLVWTEFAQIRTTTVMLSCAGCPSMVTSTALMGYGPAGRFKSTTTVPYGYTTVYKCV